MKILYSVSLKGSTNPFLKTLTDALIAENNQLEMAFSLETIWSDEIFRFDILHIMWPEFLVDEYHSSSDLKKRIIEIKQKGVHIVSTCHNIEPHQLSSIERCKAILYSYELSDVIHHMGMFSFKTLTQIFPLVKHELIPHHIYDNLYTYFPSKEESYRHLQLSSNLKYILCLGAFRSQSERDLIQYTVRHLPEKTCLIAPSFVFARKNRWDFKYYWRKYIIYNNKLIPNVYYINDDELPYYLAASHISLIHRPKILNSGNLPLGMFAGNVIIGPNVGNVGEILKETKNFVFEDIKEIPQLIRRSINSLRDGKGEENRDYAIKHWSSKQIADAVLNSYLSLMRNSLC